MAAEDGGNIIATQDAGDDYRHAQRSKFRYKSKGSRDEASGGDIDDDEKGRSHRQRQRRHYHRRSKRHRPNPPDDPSRYDDTHLPNASSKAYVDPDVAFRESLFDAMADDEGAAFWEGVYGQPIHTYSDVKQGPNGELEQMTDEEYTAYVRAKMYEKTHQHLLEEKARREAAKKERERLKEEGRREEREAEKFRQKVEESLRRGQARKNRKAWGQRWDDYTKRWEELSKSGSQDSSSAEHMEIPWPVESGKIKDITKEEIQRFFLYAPSSGQPTEAQLSKVLKVERVRWHPDKIQHKLGGQSVQESTMQAVTAVFQIIDRMWSEARDAAK